MAPFKTSSRSFDQFCNHTGVNLTESTKYDDHNVFRQLRIHELDTILVDECVEMVKATRNDDVALLKNIACLADSQSIDQLEDESDDDLNTSKEISGVGTRQAKKLMYGPLIRIFSSITNFQPDTGNIQAVPLQRVFKCLSEKPKEDFPRCPFTELVPDIQVIEYSENENTSQQWDNLYGFAEVKPSRKQGPKSQNPSVVPSIVTKSTDYARHFLNCRAHFNFCKGLLIFGTGFCVGNYNQEDTQFSPINDMFDNMDILVRVVRSMTCLLSTTEMGLDPTIRTLTDAETVALTGSTQSCPSTIIPVSSAESTTTHWCTIGRNMWSSSSLYGWRGIHVWKVRQCILQKSQKNSDTDAIFRNQGDSFMPVVKWVLADEEMILKSSWRYSHHPTESNIYRHLQTMLPNAPSLGKLQCGGDAAFLETNFPTCRMPITVQNLRDYPQCSYFISTTEPTAVLHRLVIRTAGENLWQYRDELHLLKGFRDALLAHKALSDRGILHRDISPGSILLRHSNGEDGSLSFLCDFDAAQIEQETINAPFITKTSIEGRNTGQLDQQTHIDVQGKISVKRGSLMTWTVTAQYTARELLLAHDAGIKIKHDVRHDIESFIWVLIYCIMRHITESQPSTPSLKTALKTFISEFKDAFSQPTLTGIITHRPISILALSGDFADTYELLQVSTSQALRELVVIDFDDLLTRARTGPFFPDPVHLTNISHVKLTR